MRVQHTDVEYRASHGKAPRGRGVWAFSFDAMTAAGSVTVVSECWFAPSGTLAEARKAAAAKAKEMIAAANATALTEVVFVDVKS